MKWMGGGGWALGQEGRSLDLPRRTLELRNDYFSYKEKVLWSSLNWGGLSTDLIPSSGRQLLNLSINLGFLLMRWGVSDGRPPAQRQTMRPKDRLSLHQVTWQLKNAPPPLPLQFPSPHQVANWCDPASKGPSVTSNHLHRHKRGGAASITHEIRLFY